ncbi:MAG: hypothetical protein M0Z77_05385 [Thermoplasmatales archaeon]|nr:hypothetical protein [Thermoplasmatales archaeon]
MADNKPSNFLTDLVKWMTLKRAWIIYAVALGTFVVSSLLIRNNLFISLGTTTTTILALFLIMMTSNKETRSALETEAKIFEESLKLVTAELKKVSEATLKSVETMSRVERGILKVADGTSDLLETEQGKENQRISLLRPRIFALLISEDYYTFWKHYYLSISNFGGDAKDVQLIYAKGKNRIPTTNTLLQRNRQWRVDCGDISTFLTGTVIQIEVSAYDIEGRMYAGSANIISGDTNWVEIIMKQT